MAKAGRPSLAKTGLAPKHYQFIGGLLSGKSIKDASLNAGFGQASGYDLMKNPAIRNELQRQMEVAGIDDKYLALKIKQGLNARTVPQKDGGKRYDDQFVRKQWADLAIKVKGGYAPEKIESEVKVIQLVIDGNMIQALKDSRAVSNEELASLEHAPIQTDGEIIDAEIEECEPNPGAVGCSEEDEGEESPGEGEEHNEQGQVDPGSGGASEAEDNS